MRQWAIRSSRQHVYSLRYTLDRREHMDMRVVGRTIGPLQHQNGLVSLVLCLA